MRQRSIAAAIALLLAPVALMAQPRSERGIRPGFPTEGDSMGRIEKLVGYLELSDAQRVQIEESMASHRENRQARHEVLRAGSDALQGLLESERPDATAIGNKVLELHGQRQQMAADSEAHMSALRDLLTSEQVEKLDALLAAREFTRGDRDHRPRGERKGRHDGAKRPSGR